MAGLPTLEPYGEYIRAFAVNPAQMKEERSSGYLGRIDTSTTNSAACSRHPTTAAKAGFFKESAR